MLVFFSSWGIPWARQRILLDPESSPDANLAPSTKTPGNCVPWCREQSAWDKPLTWAERCRGPGGHCRGCKECSGRNDLEPFLAEQWLNHNYCLRNVTLHTCQQLEDYNRHNTPVSPTELTLPAGMRLLLYGPSFLNEVSESIVGAHMFLGDVSVGDAHLHLNETDETTNCVPAQQLSRAHSIEVDIQRRQAKFTFSSGSFLVTVNNYGPLQHGASESRLKDLMAEHDFTHVVYMSPHSDAYFNARCLGTTGTIDTEGFEGMRCPSDHGTAESYLACVYKSIQLKTIFDHFSERYQFRSDLGAGRLTIFMPFNFESPLHGLPPARPFSATSDSSEPSDIPTFYPGDIIARVGSCKSQGSHEAVVVCIDEKQHVKAHVSHSACMQGPLLPVSRELIRQISAGAGPD